MTPAAGLTRPERAAVVARVADALALLRRLDYRLDGPRFFERRGEIEEELGGVLTDLLVPRSAGFEAGRNGGAG